MPQLGIGFLIQSRNCAVEFDLVIMLASREDRYLVKYSASRCGFGM